MNKKLSLDKQTIKLLYSKYKNYLIPSGVILFCLLLFMYVIIPQFKNFQDLQSQEEQEAKRLEVLRQNLNLLYSLDSKTLDEQLKLASKALPTSKDFIGILTGVNIAASRAGVNLGDYGFKVGDIIKSSAGAKNIPTLELVLNVSGSIDDLINFINELKNTLPLSEIKIINLSNRNSVINTVFYYKALPAVKFKDDALLNPLSSSMLETIASLEKMNNSSLIEEEILPVLNSSPSASPSGI